MSEVKRYDCGYDDSLCHDGFTGCKREDDGKLVSYEYYAKLALQLANAESKCRELASKAMELVCEASLVYSKYNDTQIPDRDLVDMQTLQEIHDLCKGVAL